MEKCSIYLLSLGYAVEGVVKIDRFLGLGFRGLLMFCTLRGVWVIFAKTHLGSAYFILCKFCIKLKKKTVLHDIKKKKILGFDGIKPPYVTTSLGQLEYHVLQCPHHVCNMCLKLRLAWCFILPDYQFGDPEHVMRMVSKEAFLSPECLQNVFRVMRTLLVPRFERCKQLWKEQNKKTKGTSAR